MAVFSVSHNFFSHDCQKYEQHNHDFNNIMLLNYCLSFAYNNNYHCCLTSVKLYVCSDTIMVRNDIHAYISKPNIPKPLNMLMFT